MTLSTVSRSQRLDEEFYQQNLDHFLAKKNRVATDNTAVEREKAESVSRRLDALESEVQKLKEQLTASHSKD